MSALELARKARALLKAECNGHQTAPLCTSPTYDINDINDKRVSGDNFLLVSAASGIGQAMQALDNSALIGLDLETTGLDPRADRVRLLSLACDTVDGGTFTYLIDCFAVDPSPLWSVLAEKDLAIHNASL